MTWADRGTLAVHARKADGSSSGSWPGCSSRGSGRNAKWARSKWPPSGVGISKWRWPWSWRLQRGTRPRRCRRCGHLASEPSAGRAGSRESDVAARPLLLLSEQARALLSHWRDDCVSLPRHAPIACVRHRPHFIDRTSQSLLKIHSRLGATWLQAHFTQHFTSLKCLHASIYVGKSDYLSSSE